MPRLDPAFLPAPFAANTIAGLRLEQGLDRPRIYWLLLAGLAGALAALPLIKIDVAVQAIGLIRSATERMEIRTAVPGRIEKILVQENQHVTTSQALIQLRTQAIDERLQFNRAKQDEAVTALLALQRLLTHYGDERPFAGQPHASNGLLLQDRSAPSDLTSSRLLQDERNVRAHWEAQCLSVAQAEAQLDRGEALAANGWITAQELANLRHERDRLQTAARLVLQEALARWEGRLKEEDRLHAGLVSEEKRLLEEKAEHTVRSPTDGTLIDFGGWGDESYVVAGQALGHVSPDDALLVEALVPPKDIGLIRPGLPVRLRVDAFPYTRWGVLPARVLSISADLISSPLAPSPGFKVMIRPDRPFLVRPDGTRAELRKGLTLSAHFVVDRRSLWNLLRDKTDVWTELRP